MDAIRVNCEAAARGDGRLLVLPGVPGCGKTFLLHASLRNLPRGVAAATSSPPPTQASVRERGLRTTVPVSPLLEDILDIVAPSFPFKNVAAQLAEIVLQRGGRTALEALREAVTSGRVPDLPRLLEQSLAAGIGPLALFLDDFDDAPSSAGTLLELALTVHELREVGHCPVAILLTMGLDARPWKTLCQVAGLNDDWHLLPGLRPWEAAEVARYCATVYPPGFGGAAITHLHQYSSGVPLVLIERLDWEEQSGRLTHDANGTFEYTPSLELWDEPETLARGAASTATAQDFFGRWSLHHRAGWTHPALVLDLMRAASIEGQVFTLEVVHSSLRAQKTLPPDLKAFPAFAAWVDSTLLGTNAGDALERGRALCRDVRGRSAAGSKYRFLLAGMRDHFWGQLAQQQATPHVQRQVGTYAQALAALGGPSKPSARLIATLFDAAGDRTRSESWHARADWGDELAVLDRCSAFLERLSPTKTVWKELAVCLAAAARASAGHEQLTKTLKRWTRAHSAAEAVEDQDLVLDALESIGGLQRELGLHSEALDTCKRGGSPERRAFAYLEGTIWLALGDQKRALDLFHAALSSLGRHPRWTRVAERLNDLDLDALTTSEAGLATSWATLICEIGHLHAAVGYPDKAVDLVTKGEEVLTLLLGTDDDGRLRASAGLGVLLYQTGRLERAKELFSEVLEVQNRVLGPDNSATILTKRHLVMARLDTGDQDLHEAERIYREILDCEIRQLGPANRQTVATQISLAGVVRDLGDLRGAELLLTQALETLSRGGNVAQDPWVEAVRTALGKLHSAGSPRVGGRAGSRGSPRVSPQPLTTPPQEIKRAQRARKAIKRAP